MGGIFICYRRKDTDYIAGRLHRQLADHFGSEQVFRDINAIKLGSDFGERIDSFVGECDALVAVIGDDWLNTTDEDGRRRIDQPGDWVRQEIASAFERDVLVVPVLVENAKMPTEAELPPTLRSLARREALDLSDARWDFEVESLIEALEEVVEARPDPITSRRPADRRRDGASLGSRPAPPPVFAVPSAPPTPEPPRSTYRPAPRAFDAPSSGGDWSSPAPRSAASGFPSWAMVAVSVLVGGLAIAVILALTAGGDDASPPSTSLTTSPDGVAPTSVPPVSVVPTSASPGAKTFTGPWTGRNGRLTLIVERVEVGSSIRLHMLVVNGSTDSASLPVFHNFSAFDDAGHNYEAAEDDWATEFPPGAIRGTIVLTEPLQPGASSLKVGFGTIFSRDFDLDGGIFVEGIQVA